ncbi:MAG: radical SAM protein [Elusimicrobia bacterium]|nr:radical SAM protein [Elusimicrobiota bacterium]
MYYRLRDHCHLILGALRGAIYDLQAGRVYSINRRAVEMLQRYQTCPIDGILTSRSADAVACREFFDKLSAMNLGAIYFEAPPEKAQEVLASAPAQFRFLWLELTSACNNSCVHCYSASGRQGDNDRVPKERWLSLIAEARKEGASALQFIGGEPLLVPYWRELVREAGNQKYGSVEIFTNGTLIDDGCVSFFKEHGVRVATTIYGADAGPHDRVTGNAGSFDKTLAALRRLVASNIPTRAASIISRLNEDEAEKIQDFCKSLGVKSGWPDVVRPTGRGNDPDILPRHYQRAPVRPPFRTGRSSFYRARQFNSCFSGKIAITPRGDVLPCIFARSQICGNVLEAPLKEVIWGEALQRCWNTTKDVVEKCMDCEYRYACEDCRPLAQGQDPLKCWLSRSQGCSYDPYSGKWPVDISLAS